jgi:ATP-dependent RNA helicase RhlE
LRFESLNISKPVLRALLEEGYTKPSPIQTEAIPPLLEGHDLLGCAQTGTGKTAAFAVPILDALSFAQRSSPARKEIKALILAPTRELAIQIGESFDTYGKYLSLKTAVIFGGVSQHPQTKALASGIDILVATPGRLLDLIGQRFIKLANVSHFVLDEADRMLDMGMLRDVKRVIAELPKQRQTMFFSATMPPEIAELAGTILSNPVKVEITPVSSTVDTIRQTVYFVNKCNKARLLIHLLNTMDVESALVFSRTKHGADKIVKTLHADGIDAMAIHGNKSQNARQLALGNFKSRKTRILVATDIAARGIDVDELSHVFIYDLPEVPETYVHRIGRTGRAGLGGTAISFCDKEEKLLLRDIQKLIQKTVPVVDEHPFPLDETIDETSKKTTRGGRQGHEKAQKLAGEFLQNRPNLERKLSTGHNSSNELRKASSNTGKPSNELRKTSSNDRKASTEVRKSLSDTKKKMSDAQKPSTRSSDTRISMLEKQSNDNRKSFGNSRQYSDARPNEGRRMDRGSGSGDQSRKNRPSDPNRSESQRSIRDNSRTAARVVDPFKNANSRYF